MTLEELREVAIRAAEAGSEVIRAWADRGAVVGAEVKGHGDYVTEVDRAAEAAALEVLRAATPAIAILAEESGGDPLQAGGRLWAVDPLDGTTNFVRGFPVVGVSVGLVEDGLPVVGAVAAPLLDGACWSAARGLGAHDRGGRRLHVAGGDGTGVAATGFPFRRPDNLSRYTPVLEGALAAFEDLRRAGAACLDLAYTAAAAFDGFFELGLATWDVAGGGALVLEAGGVVTDWAGDDRAWIRSGDIVAGSPAWHERMLDIIRTAAAHRPPASSGAVRP